MLELCYFMIRMVSTIRKTSTPPYSFTGGYDAQKGFSKGYGKDSRNFGTYKGYGKGYDNYNKGTQLI